jgi:hypothetical protein
MTHDSVAAELSAELSAELAAGVEALDVEREELCLSRSAHC